MFHYDENNDEVLACRDYRIVWSGGNSAINYLQAFEWADNYTLVVENVVNCQHGVLISGGIHTI